MEIPQPPIGTRVSIGPRREERQEAKFRQDSAAKGGLRFPDAAAANVLGQQ
jgi:hypothetical protein